MAVHSPKCQELRSRNMTPRVIFLTLLCFLATFSVCLSENTTDTTNSAPDSTPTLAGTSPNKLTASTVRSGNDSSVKNGGQISSARDCILDTQSNMTETLHELFSTGAVFIYFSLDFDDSTEIYTNSSDVIDPSTWVWAIEGKGELLLSYPFDFQQLSLGTLSQGVFQLHVTVDLPDDGCFERAADVDRQQMLARFILHLVQSAGDSLKQNQDLYADKKSLVCLEKQLTSDDFDIVGVYAIPLCTYYIFQGSTAHECWPGDEDPFIGESRIIRKHGWLGAILALGFILALFSPLAAGFFIRKNPPTDLGNSTGELYVALNSDLPLGLKYLLLFSFQDCPAVVALRWFIYVVAFMLIPLIPFIVSYSVRGSAFIHRMNVAYELLLSEGLVIMWFIIIYLLFLAITMLLLGLYLFQNDFIQEGLQVQKDDRQYFGAAVEMPNKLHVPKKSGPCLSVFMYTMLFRTQMAINPSVWAFWFNDIWTYISGVLGKKSDEDQLGRCSLIVAYSIFIITLPFAFLVFLFLLLLNSVPLIYTLTWTITKTVKRVTASEVVMAFMIMFLSFAVLFIFVAAFTFIAEVLGYTFIGFVLNADFAGPIVVAFVTVSAYLISAATDFYDGYCTLLKTLIEKAHEVDREADKKAHSPQAISPTTTVVGGAQHIQMQTHNQSPLLSSHKMVEIKNGVPHIPMHLFKLVITKYKPMYLEVASIFMKLLTISVVIAFGLATIIFIDGVSDLPAVVEFFATVVVAGVVPTLMLILKSPAKEENEKDANIHRLEVDLEFYANCPQDEKTFESMVL